MQKIIKQTRLSLLRFVNPVFLFFLCIQFVRNGQLVKFISIHDFDHIFMASSLQVIMNISPSSSYLLTLSIFLNIIPCYVEILFSWSMDWYFLTLCTIPTSRRDISWLGGGGLDNNLSVHSLP